MLHGEHTSSCDKIDASYFMQRIYSFSVAGYDRISAHTNVHYQHNKRVIVCNATQEFIMHHNKIAEVPIL